MLKALRVWWLARVRGFGPGRHNPEGWYVRITPNFGFAFQRRDGSRIRYARHHGLQRVEWREGRDAEGQPVGRWMVARQLVGRSSVKGEKYLPHLPKPSAVNISSIT